MNFSFWHLLPHSTQAWFQIDHTAFSTRTASVPGKADMNSSLTQDFKSRIFIINGAILLLFAVLISISNGLLLFVIYKDPLKTFRNATAVLIISLGVSDFLTGCVTAVDVGISHILEGLAIQKVMLQAKIISQVTVRASVYILIMFAVERFIAVAFPYVYRTSVTIRKTIVGCALCWVLAIVTSCLELVVHQDLYDVVFFYIIFVLSLVTMCFTYCATYCLVKTSAERLHRQCGGSGCKYRERGSVRKEKMSKQSVEQQKQLMKTASLIILVFVLSLVPFWSFTAIRRYCKGCAEQGWFIAGYRFSIPILYSNSALNPLLYAWRMRPYRRSFEALFGRKGNCGRRGSREMITSNVKVESKNFVIAGNFTETKL